MATENSFINNALRGSGSRVLSHQVLPIVVNGNTTVTGTFSLPAGSWLNTVGVETPTAISGSPTSCLTRAGITLHGQEILADVDGKAQGHISGTVVASFDKIGGLATATTVYVEITTSGGTSSAGTINVVLSYAVPVT